MEMIFCPNCGKLTGYKRMLGFGTLFAVLFTAGFWLLAIPFYPKRCITCGLSKSVSVPWHRTWRIGLVLAVVFVGFAAMLDKLFPPEPSSPAVIVHGPDYDKPVGPRSAKSTETATLVESNGRTLTPDVIDPTHSTQWLVGGLSGHELLQRMRADSSGPLSIKGVIDDWTPPKLVYSDSQENIYIEADAIDVQPFPAYAAGPPIGDPGWGNLLAYIQDRQFGGWFVTEFKDPELTRSLIDAIQSSHPNDLHPELLKYRTQELWFDLSKGTVTGSALNIHDVDGDFLASPKFSGKYVLSLTPDSRWSVIAHNIAALLEHARKDPKVADGIERITAER